MPATHDAQRSPQYVYGVVPAGAAVSVEEAGVGGEAVRLVEDDGVAAVVSAFAGVDVRLRRRDLLAHLRTLERVFEQATVAPCPFGTVVGEDVREAFLAPRREELRRLLQRLEGHAQMNVKVEYEEDTILGEIVAQDRDVARARERTKALGSAAYYENIRLGELISARLAERRAVDAEAIHARLSALAAEAAPEAVEGELLVYKGSFLVARTRLEEFDAATEALVAGRPGRMRFDVIGPLPPAAFATLEAAG